MKEILDLLTHILGPSLVSTFELPWIAVNAKKDGLQAALGELEEMIASLPEDDRADELQLDVLRRAVRRIWILLLQNAALPVSV